jgi:hypothetical protein
VCDALYFELKFALATLLDLTLRFCFVGTPGAPSLGEHAAWDWLAHFCFTSGLRLAAVKQRREAEAAAKAAAAKAADAAEAVASAVAPAVGAGAAVLATANAGSSSSSSSSAAAPAAPAAAGGAAPAAGPASAVTLRLPASPEASVDLFLLVVGGVAEALRSLCRAPVAILAQMRSAVGLPAATDGSAAAPAAASSSAAAAAVAVAPAPQPPLDITLHESPLRDAKPVERLRALTAPTLPDPHPCWGFFDQGDGEDLRCLNDYSRSLLHLAVHWGNVPAAAFFAAVGCSPIAEGLSLAWAGDEMKGGRTASTPLWLARHMVGVFKPAGGGRRGPRPTAAGAILRLVEAAAAAAPAVPAAGALPQAAGTRPLRTADGAGATARAGAALGSARSGCSSAETASAAGSTASARAARRPAGAGAPSGPLSVISAGGSSVGAGGPRRIQPEAVAAGMQR